MPYSLDSDSSRWWWPQAAAGAVGAAAITAILVVPGAGLTLPAQSTPEPTPAAGAWSNTVDRDLVRPCFLTRARWNVALDQPRPRCGWSRSSGP